MRYETLRQAYIENESEVIFTLYSLYVPVVPPVITVGPLSTRDVVAGEVLSVTCAAVGEPAPQILWYHRGLILDTNVSNSATTAKTTTSSLKVQNVSNEDDGPYSCVAVNFLGNDSSNFTVSLIGELNHIIIHTFALL